MFFEKKRQNLLKYKRLIKKKSHLVYCISHKYIRYYSNTTKRVLAIYGCRYSRIDDKIQVSGTRDSRETNYFRDV